MFLFLSPFTIFKWINNIFGAFSDIIYLVQERLASTVLSNNELTDDETVNRSEYDRLTQQIQHEKQLSIQLKENITTYYDLLHRYSNYYF